MFFICGVNQGQKQFDFHQTVVCPRCGRHEGEGVSVEKLRQLGVYKNYNSKESSTNSRG